MGGGSLCPAQRQRWEGVEAVAETATIEASVRTDTLIGNTRYEAKTP